MMTGTIFMVEVECANCITHFGVDKALIDRCKVTGREFYCPMGHRNVYRETELTKLERRNQALQKRLTWAEQSADRALAELTIAKKERTSLKGQLTKTRKRVANGVCPCCNRTFVQLAKHMDNKHPDYKAVVG